MTQTKKSDAVKIGSSVGATCLGEYTPFLSIDSLPREKASIGSKKWMLLPSEILMELESEDEEPLTAPPRSNVNLSNPWTHAQPHEPPQHHEAVLPQGRNVLPQGPNALPQGPNVLPQGPNNQSGATPSSVWPSDLIPILRQIAALSRHQPSKPLFNFSFSLEATNKNFIILKRKFGGDLSKALLVQSHSPLGYGSEFKLTKTLELIFKNHPTWTRMKRVLEQGSKWPLQHLDEEDRVKDIEEALGFGNHKGAIQRQNLLKNW